MFACHYVHSVHEFYSALNRCVGVWKGSGSRLGVLFGVSWGALDGAEGASLEWLGCVLERLER